MIALIVGWHFVAIGILTIILALMCGIVSWLVIGLGVLVMGLILSVRFNKACASYRSDPVEKRDTEVPLDYY